MGALPPASRTNLGLDYGCGHGRPHELSAMVHPTRSAADVSAPPTVKVVPLADRPRTAEFEWLRAHAREYAGQWVALDGSRLLARVYRPRPI